MAHTLKPNATAVVVRTAMIGGGLSYDVEVPVECIADLDRSTVTNIIRDGKYFVRFEEATKPVEQQDMPQGWAKYDAWLEHRREARKRAFRLARSVYWELDQLPEDSELPELWVVGLMPEETSDARVVPIES